jgi:hypothetical protein
VTGAVQTLVANVPENFESGIRDWSADRGTWEVGRPTSGPNGAHGGTNCAATVLKGDYYENVDSRLVSPAFIVPPVVDNPRLRFWHWFRFNGGDTAQVEIKVGTNSWQSLSDSYSSYSSGVWSAPSLDLSAYAGRSVQIGFRFRSQGAYCCTYWDVDNGWYVDDVSVVTGPTQALNPESFEFGLGAWSADRGTWEVGRPTSGPNAAHGGTNCAATVLAGDYYENVDSRLLSPPFVVPPAATNPRLRFWHWYRFNGGDFGQVQIKVGTNSWHSLSTDYTSTSGGVWSQPQVLLSAYAGQSVQIGFYFHSQGTFCCTYWDVDSGWYVDEVRLQHDLSLLAGSTIIRTQEAVCVSLAIAVSTPPLNANFTLQIPAGTISNLTLTPAGCWTGSTLTPLSTSEWLLRLRNSCSNTSMGVQIVGSLCFTASSTQSVFSPFTLHNLVVTNQDLSVAAPVRAFDGRTVIVGNQPLLESWRGTNGQRMVTTYGKPNRGYVIRYATSATNASPWTLSGITNLMPASMFFSQPVTGVPSAPIIFLRANER